MAVTAVQPMTTFFGIFEPASVSVSARPAFSIRVEGSLKVEATITNLRTNAGDFAQLCAERWTHFRDNDSLRLEHDQGFKVTYRVTCQDTAVTRAAIERLQQERITLDEIMCLLVVLDLFWD